MKFFFGLLLLHILPCASAQVRFERTAESLRIEAQQIEYWTEKLAQSSKLSPKEKFDLLEIGLRNMGDRSKGSDHDPRVDVVYREIQSTFLSIPGHAEYYRDKIYEEDRQFKLKDEERKNKGQPTSQAYYRSMEQMWAFETLSNLPSAETLGVLGEILLDTSNLFSFTQVEQDESAIETYLNQRPLFGESMNTLEKMIEEPPAPTDFRGPKAEKNIDKWQHWYIQVKEGRRTVRFKGNPQEYDLTGPVRDAKNPDIPRADRRLDARKEFQSPERAPDFTASPSSWIVGLITILLALGGWLFMRKKAAS